MGKRIVWGDPTEYRGRQSPNGMLTQERIDRVNGLVTQSYKLLDEALYEHIVDAGRNIAATVVLFSGGNDSTNMANLYRSRATHALHCNTGIGIEQTRQFVRDTCTLWGLPLIELYPDENRTFQHQVTRFGFPGPSRHDRVFYDLKGRQMERCLQMLNGDARKSRVAFIGGRRRAESAKRKKLPYSRRKGAAVYIDPLADWTAIDMNTYRMMNPAMPHNEVTDLLHMSGECLCGAYAKPGELEMIGACFPEMRKELEELELTVANAGQRHCKWGWNNRNTTCQYGCNI